MGHTVTPVRLKSISRPHAGTATLRRPTACWQTCRKCPYAELDQDPQPCVRFDEEPRSLKVRPQPFRGVDAHAVRAAALLELRTGAGRAAALPATALALSVPAGYSRVHRRPAATSSRFHAAPARLWAVQRVTLLRGREQPVPRSLFRDTVGRSVKWATWLRPRLLWRGG